jgi:hypothetical protein
MPLRTITRFSDLPASLRSKCWLLLAIAGYVVEMVLFTNKRGCFGPYWSPFVFLSGGLLLCGAALGALRDQPFTYALAAQTASRVGWSGVIWLAGAVLVLHRQVPVVLGSPLDVRVSDVIPIVQTYVDRFRSGEVVYRYLTNLPYPLFPNHLPLQWLPYVPLQRFGIDFRWLSLALLLLPGFGAYQLLVLRQPNSWLSFWLKALLPAVAMWWMIKRDDSLFSQVLEPTIICYYFLLATSVLSRSAWAQGLALVLCLMSRYSVIFWVPFFLLLLWRGAGRRHTLLVVAIVVAGSLVVYIVPFLAKDPTIFLHALAEYRIATIGAWSGNNGTAPDGLPWHISNGLSAAPWFYTYLHLPLEVKVTWVQRIHLLASAGVVVLLTTFYWRYGRRYDYRYLALVGLKLYLAVFYFFIQIPYAYLISLSVLLSVFVLLVVVGPRQVETTAPGTHT